MKKITFIILSLFFVLQSAYAEANISCVEEDMAKDNPQECPTTGDESKRTTRQVVISSSIITACIAATTVAALPMTRNLLGTNFSTQALKSPIAVYASVSTPPHQEDLDFSTTKNIISNPQLLVATPFEVKIINDGIKLVSLADDFQLEHRTSLDYDFFKHRFSRLLS